MILNFTRFLFLLAATPVIAQEPLKEALAPCGTTRRIGLAAGISDEAASSRPFGRHTLGGFETALVGKGQ
ncbi:MAG: hypothetical protein IPH31_23175 [Lewinellaceae bacterium]|nr:hypothetical protein [Lewinellaceae bacterium]